MTEKECLEKMVDIWGYLADNPSKKKVEAYNELGLVGDMNRCPCCEYAYQQCGNCYKMCVLCPLKDFWPNGLCTSVGSPYMEWLEAKKNHVKQGAIMTILNASTQKLMEVAG